jgi:hypothetical protein
LTGWTELGGPVIGFKYEGVTGKYPNSIYNNMSLIIGDICRPKFFGARKLFVLLGQKVQVQFYW